MMRIDHLAIWCNDIEQMRKFYMDYFGFQCNELYVNAKGFHSYFLSFSDGGCRIEIMQRADITRSPPSRGFALGVAHFDIEVGVEQSLLDLTERLRSDGYTIASEPRVTGDGYFESAVLDPEGNYVEMSADKKANYSL